MTELSLNILDVAQNCITAKATLVEINVSINTKNDTLVISIKDNGCGMSEQQLQKVTDPFYTTRTTRKVGLGVSLFKMAAEMTGGSFEIKSQIDVGTNVTARFELSSIDRMPLGDVCATIESLIVYNTHVDFIYKYCLDDEEFSLSTIEMKEILDGVPLNSTEVHQYIKEYLYENTAIINKQHIF